MPARIVLITGANSGVGYAASKVIASASEDFHVIMAGRSLERLAAAQSEIEASGVKGSLSALHLDITDEESVRTAARLVANQHGHLDVLVNNAAVGNIDDNVKYRFQTSMETNVTGPAVVADAFRPLLFKSTNPYSIYVSSGAGSLTLAAEDKIRARVPPNPNAYSASKAALNMIAIHEYKENKAKGLKVFAMCPGFVRSNLRGPGEEARSGWGNAGDPMVSGQTLLSIIQGKRDADVGGFVHKDGTYPW